MYLRHWYSNYGYTITHIHVYVKGMNGGPVIDCVQPCHNKELKHFVCSIYAPKYLSMAAMHVNVSQNF